MKRSLSSVEAVPSSNPSMIITQSEALRGQDPDTQSMTWTVNVVEEKLEREVE